MNQLEQLCEKAVEFGISIQTKDEMSVTGDMKVDDTIIIERVNHHEQLVITICKRGDYMYIDDEFDASYSGCTADEEVDVILFRICNNKKAYDIAVKAIRLFVESK